MVFHKALPFTRLTLGKSLTHGPQSVLAASQSWNASHPLNNRFQKYHAPSHTALSALQPKSTKDAHDAAFADYLRKWQRDQRLGANHWRQYQIYKPLEWKSREAASEAKLSEEQDDSSTLALTGSKEATDESAHVAEQHSESVGLEILAKEEIAIESSEKQRLSQNELAVEDESQTEDNAATEEMSQ